MPTVVSKFGGSSTANAACFRRVLDIVRASPGRRCVVLSAPGIDETHREKVTAMLEECWRSGDAGRVGRIAERYGEIAEGLGVKGFYEVAKDEIRRALGASRERLLSRGEYLSAKLFSMYGGLEMADAAQLVRFDGLGRLLYNTTLENLARLAERRGPVVVPGFYGADASGRVHLFPRNGSDITGALAAAGLGAGLYENWTDVPGLMTADPAIVPGARLIPQVSYRQMRALSRAGAQVLHPACLDPVALSGIPTRLRSTMDPASFGTLIDERVESVAACIAGKKEGETARITVFGVNRERILEAIRETAAQSIQSKDDCSELVVERDLYEATIRHLHRVLIE